ncbi:unnamed protein product [Ectocarpus sp. 8 AP-2014]
MASAAEELTQTHAASITRASTLLVDDDVNNVNIALSEGVNSVWCNPKDPTSMITELLSLAKPHEKAPNPAGSSSSSNSNGAGSSGGGVRGGGGGSSSSSGSSNRRAEEGAP